MTQRGWMFALAHANFRENATSMRGPRDVQNKKKENLGFTIEILTTNYNYIKTLTCAKSYDELISSLMK